MANMIIKRENEQFEIEMDKSIKNSPEIMQKIEKFIMFAKSIQTRIEKNNSISIEGVILEPIVCRIIYQYPENKILVKS